MNDEFFNIATRVITGEASPEEQQNLQDEMLADTEKARVFGELRQAWEEAAALEQPSFASEDWEKMEARLENNSAGKGWIGQMRYWSSAAAVAVIACAAWIIWSQYNTMIFSAETADLEISLPDQSRVTLKKGSSIRYARNFSDNRSVELDGEGYFQVVSDKIHPFTVETGKTTTTVLGTAFILRESADEKKVDLIVTEGKVSFEAKGGQIILEKGQAARFTGEAIESRNDVSSNEVLWTEKAMEFKVVKLSGVVRDLEHFFGVTIQLDEAAANCPVNMDRIVNPTPEQIKTILEGIFPSIRVEINEKNWTIKGNC